MLRLNRDLLHQPRYWPAVMRRAIDLTIIQRQAPRYYLPSEASEDKDGEAILWEHRANWLLNVAACDGVHVAAKRFDNLLARDDLASDSYSASQRLAHAAYLFRLLPQHVLPIASCKRLIADALHIVERPEFRLHNDWFNNHLLNNYRGLSLALAQIPLDWPETTYRQLEHLDRLLVRYADTLFENGQGPILAEGSVSYELLILRHLIDLQCGGMSLPLRTLITNWLEDVGAYVQRYRYDDRWLLPAIGDLCPDWRKNDIEIFLNGVFLGVDNVYSKLWTHELEHAGFSLRAMKSGGVS